MCLQLIEIVDLEIGDKTVYFAGKPRQAIATNNQIPVSTLHFKEGGRVTIKCAISLDLTIV
jgi:hypothetical protein